MPYSIISIAHNHHTNIISLFNIYRMSEAILEAVASDSGSESDSEGEGMWEGEEGEAAEDRMEE